MNRPSSLYQTSQINYSSLSATKRHKCQNCGLQFESSYELMNHTKKFCTNSGFDTLAGLNIKLKNPHYMAQKQQKRKLNDSLTYALEEIQKNKAFIPAQREMKNDLLEYQKHRGAIDYVRPYLHGSSKKTIELNNSGRKSRSLFIKQGQAKQKTKQGHKANDSSYAKYQPQKSKAYSFTSSYIKKFKQSNVYISPPSHLPYLQNAKQYSLLDRSDMSIKNMPEQEKREYVVRKILQLQSIEEGYKKNGGRNEQFVQNTVKMKKFYQELLEDVNSRKEEMFGKMSNGTRVSTPISKLDQLKQSGVLVESRRQGNNRNQKNLQSRIAQIHQKSMAKRQNKVRQRFKTEFPQPHQQQLQTDILDNQLLTRLKHKDNQNQIIVIPIQHPSNQPINYPPPQPSKQTQLTLKYLQTVNAMKQQQNKNYLQLLQKQNSEMKKMYEQNMKNKEKQFTQNQNKINKLQNKYIKLVETIQKQKEKDYQRRNLLEHSQHNDRVTERKDDNKNFRLSRNKQRQHYRTECSLQGEQVDKEYRQLYPQLNNIRVLNIEQSGFNTQPEDSLSSEQKILKQMQHQERDQFQLFSHLPPQIQQLKLQSIKLTGQKRFYMEKQVIKQKLQKLHLIESMKHFELQRTLLTEQLQNQKKKMQIHKLMKKKIKNMVKEEFVDRDSKDGDSEEDNSIDGNVNDPFQFPRKPLSTVSRTLTNE